MAKKKTPPTVFDKADALLLKIQSANKKFVTNTNKNIKGIDRMLSKISTINIGLRKVEGRSRAKSESAVLDYLHKIDK
jgi:hypothetical protein